MPGTPVTFRYPPPTVALLSTFNWQVNGSSQGATGATASAIYVKQQRRAVTVVMTAGVTIPTANR